jgi:hypothetical protein
VASTVGIVWGGLAAAAPMLFNIENWQGLLKATPARSEVALGLAPLAVQMLQNVVAGAQAFLANSHNTHYVAGPHVDPGTALLILVGLAATLVGVRKRSAVAWLAASLLFSVAVSGIQQYGWVATTRMFILVPIYALYGGLGAAAIAEWSTRRGVRAAGALVCVALCVVLNQLHILRISHPNNTAEARGLLVREYQSTAAEDGGGVPIYTIWSHPHPMLESLMLRAHDVPRERIRLIRWEELREIPDFCTEEDPRAVLLHLEHPAAAEIHSHMRGCWPGGDEVAVRDHVGEARLYRYANPAASVEFARPPTGRASDRSRPDTLQVPRPVDAVADHRGRVFVLSGRPPSVWRFSEELEHELSFPLIQSKPTAMALTPEGVLVVGSEGDHPRLVWYDADGAVIRRLAGDVEVSVPRGISVAADGSIWLADPGYNRVSLLSPNGLLIGKFTAGGRLVQPGSVAATGDGGVWALNTSPSEWLRLTARDEVEDRFSTEHMDPVDASRLVLLADGSLLTAAPYQRRIVRRAADGQLLDIRSGFERPLSLTIDRRGRILVVERTLDHVAVLPPL